MQGSWSFATRDGTRILQVEYDQGNPRGKIVFYRPLEMEFYCDETGERREKRSLILNGKQYRADDPSYGKVLDAMPSPDLEHFRWIPLDPPMDPLPVLAMQETMPNGSRKTLVEYTPVSERGRTWYVRHGKATSFYANGKEKACQYYDFGVEHGVFQGWYADGSPDYKVEYREGSPLGTWRFWHPNGQMAGEGDVSLDGQCEHWHFWDDKGGPLSQDNIGKWVSARLQ